MGIWKDKVRKDWRYRFQYLGENYAGGGYKTRKEAASSREDRRKEIKESGKQTRPDMGFRYLSSVYLDYAERRFVKKTYKYKKYVYKSFLDHFGDLAIDSITPQHIHNYLNTRSTNYNYNAHLKDLSALFTYIKKKLKIEIQNPCQDLEKLPHTARRKEIPTEEDFLKIILAADPKTDEQDLILTITHSFARVDEVLRLKWSDINFDTRLLTKWTRKRKGGAYTPVHVPMNQDLYDILWRKWQHRIQDEWVFFNEQTGDRYNHRPKMMASICKRAGIKPIGKGFRKIAKGKNKGTIIEIDLYYGFHAIRHFISSYTKNKKKVETKVLQELLGHTEERTTQIYLHSIDENLRLATGSLEGDFSPKNKYPQATPASIKEKDVT